METIFRKVSVNKRLPKHGRYLTDWGWLNYEGLFPNEIGTHWYEEYEPNSIPRNPNWWFEEIQFPTDDELEKRFPTNINEASDIKGTNSDNLCKQLGAEWMRDFILGY